MSQETKTVYKQVVQVIQASIEANSDSESSIFLQWVWLVSDSIGPHPPDHPVSRVLD